jgi:hypothetical protein
VAASTESGAPVSGVAALASWIADRLWWLPAVVVVAFAFRGVSAFEFSGDARLLIADNAYLTIHRLWANLTHDYSWSSVGGSSPVWRPVTKGSFVFEAAAFGRWAGGYHLVNLAWHLAGVIVAELLASSLGARRRLAILAGLLYGLHPSAIEPVCLIGARSDVASTAAAGWAIYAWLGWRRAVDRDAAAARRWALLHVLCVALALGSKGWAVVIAPVLTLWVLFDRSGGSFSLQARRRLVTPAWALTALYLLARWRVLSGTTAPAVTLDPLRILVAGGAYLQALVPFRLEPAIRSVSLVEAHDGGTLVGAAAAWIVAAAALGFAVRKRLAGAVALILFALATLVPLLLVEQAFAPGMRDKLALADRWLLPAVLTSSVVWVLLACAVPSRVVAPGIALVGALWTVITVLLAPTAHAYYYDESTKLELDEIRFRETPQPFRTAEDHCRHRDRAMVSAERLGHLEIAIGLANTQPDECDVLGVLRLVSALCRGGRFAEARPLADRLVGADWKKLGPRARGPALHLAGITAFGTGDPARAAELFARAESQGLASCALFADEARAATALGREDAESLVRRAAACVEVAPHAR